MAEILRTRIPWGVDGIAADAIPDETRSLLEIARPGLKPLQVSRPQLARLEADALRSKLATFHDGNPFAFGSLGRLLGRKVGRLGSTRLAVTISNPARFNDVKPQAALVPSVLTGTITGQAPRSRPLGIVRDGRVIATTVSTLVDGREVFEALIPKFTSGSNRFGIITPAQGGRFAELNGALTATGGSRAHDHDVSQATRS